MNPVVHFEIIGKDAEGLRDYYAKLFGWESDTDAVAAPEVSDAGSYGFIRQASAGGQGAGIAGGIGGGASFTPHVIFYVGVDDVTEMLERAESLGGTRVLGPVRRPDGKLMIAHFADPEGNVIGLAGPR